MEPQAYALMATQEAHHWWYVARRKIISSMIGHCFGNATELNILDAGCGSGGNLPTLATLGKVSAFEMHESARDIANARRIAVVESGSFPTDIPFANERFDLITCCDVLEHAEGDITTLAALKQRLTAQGKLIITVPAMPWLWSHHDEQHHHLRRYTRTHLMRVLKQAGLTVEFCSYYNFWLFPLAVAARLMDKLRPKHADSLGTATPAAPLNRLLGSIMASERFLMPQLRLPFGVSLIAVAKPS